MRFQKPHFECYKHGWNDQVECVHCRNDALQAENRRIKDGWDATDAANKNINARLTDTLSELSRCRESIKRCREIFHHYLRKTKSVRLDMLSVEKENRELKAELSRCHEVVEAAERAVQAHRMGAPYSKQVDALMLLDDALAAHREKGD